ncbi:hypothetical protein [Desulfocicer niacini]
MHSKPDKGTSFFVYLPEISPTKQRLSAKHHPGHQLNGQESILVVDDEKTILVMLEQILSRYGYRVSSYANSIKALNGMAGQTKPDKILMKPVSNDDLLITIRNILDNRSIESSPSKSPSPQ